MEVACLKGWGPVADQLKAAGIDVTAFGMRRSTQLFRAVRQLRELVKSRSIDTVASFLIHANSVAAVASKKLPGRQFIQSIQTIQPNPKWHWWLQSRIHHGADRVLAPSNAVAEVAEKRCGVPQNRIVVIPNAIDPEEFPRIEVFVGPRIGAGYLGRLDPMKSPASLIQALESSGIEEAELHYFGDGPDRARLESLAANLPGRVFFHGAIARPQDALRQMDVLWLPSWVEGFGLVLIEAMASGVPVVACNGGGVTDIVQDGFNGLLASEPMGDYRRFAASISELRDNPALRQQLIENGLRTVREKFTWNVVLPQYHQLFGLDQS